MASLSRSFVLHGESQRLGPGEPRALARPRPSSTAPRYAGAHSPQLLNLPDVVLDQSTNGLIAITWRGKAAEGDTEGKERKDLRLGTGALVLGPLIGYHTRAFPQKESTSKKHLSLGRVYASIAGNSQAPLRDGCYQIVFTILT